MRPVKQYAKFVLKPGLRRALVEVFLLFFLVIALAVVFFYMAGEELMLDNFRDGDMMENIQLPSELIQPVIDSAIDSAADEIARNHPDAGEWLSKDLKTEYRKHLDKDEFEKCILDHYKSILHISDGDSIYITRIDTDTKNDLSKSYINPGRFYRALFAKPEVLLIPLLLIFLAFLMAPRILKSIKTLTISAENLATGDLDTEISVDEIDEVGILGRALDKMRINLKENIIELQNTAHELANELNEKNVMLDKARNLQRSFFPEYVEKGSLKVATGFMPCEDLGGDFFDLLDLGAGKICFIFGDVEGHGISASFNMMSVLTVFRLRCRENPNPEYIAHEINEMIFRERDDISRQFSATALIGIIDMNTDNVTFVNAGHPNPIIWRSRKEAAEELTDGNPLLGIQENYIYKTVTLDIEEDDKLLLYTDGLIWNVNADGEYFGIERLSDLFARNCDLQAEDIINIINDQIKRFKSAKQQNDDDILFSVFSFEAERWSYLQIPPLTKDDAITEIVNSLEKFGIPNDIISDFHLSMDELITNAIYHGNREDKSKNVYVKYMYNHSEVRMQVSDEGEGFLRDSSTFFLDREQIYEAGKRGIYLVKSLMDEMFYNEKGNEVTIVKRIINDNW